MSKNRALFYNNLSTMLDAGLPISRCLTTAAEGLKGKLPKCFTTLPEAISKGHTLTEAMAQHPRLFPPLDIMMTDAAENSGRLPESFRLLANWYAFSRRIMRRILSAMVLPVCYIHIAALLAPLPLLFLGRTTADRAVTEAVLILSYFYVPAVIIFAVIRFMPRTGLLRTLLDTLVLKIPLLGHAFYHLALTRYLRAFYMLFKAGVPITQAAEKATAVTANATVARLVKGASISAQQGRPLYEGFSPKLPAEFRNAWQTGEESGSLDDVTRHLADKTAEHTEFLFDEFARWLPKLIYLLVCLMMLYYISRGLSAIGRI